MMTSTDRRDEAVGQPHPDDAEPVDDRSVTETEAEPEPAAEQPADRLTYAQMLEQLEAMARQVATDAPPALRDMSAVAAIFGATTARNAGPIAHTLADATDVYGNRLADRLEAYAERVRADTAGAAEAGNDDDVSQPSPTDGADPPDRDRGAS